MIGEVKQGMDTLKEDFDELGETMEEITKKLDSMLEGPLEGIERKLDAMIEDLVDRICDGGGEMGDVCEATAHERGDRCQRALAELRDLREESSSR